MLKRLAIKNLAIIENIECSFDDGLTVLTGETGAGKSLLIDSLSLLSGERASSELIRQGADKAVIKGTFLAEGKALEPLFLKLSIPFSMEIEVERTISPSKSSARVNGVLVSLSDLAAITSKLVNIHNQFDFAKILSPENYLGILDAFSSSLIAPYKQGYQTALKEYEESKESLITLLKRQEQIEKDRDFYEYQLQELKAMHLEAGEEERIAEEISLLKNHDKIYSLEQDIKRIADGDFLDDFYNLNQSLGKLSSYQSQYEGAKQIIDDRYYEIADLLQSLRKSFADIDYDPNRLDELENRDNDLAALRRKYKRSVNELIAYRDELSSLLDNEGDLVNEIARARKISEEKKEVAFQKGDELSLLRQKAAKRIEKDIEGSLSALRLKSKFLISFAKRPSNEDSYLFEDGVDQIDFLIETNAGEGLKSLAKTVSGGEANRVMFAFKELYVKAKGIQTIVFDEIDAGISGETALAVAKKIHDISRFCQVIAITHMPQVASFSDHHFLISKEERGKRTFASIKELSLQEKIHQVAYLISGGNVTKKQLEYAEEMILSSHN